jgi:hypothetical protein
MFSHLKQEDTVHVGEIAVTVLLSFVAMGTTISPKRLPGGIVFFIQFKNNFYVM